MGTYKVIQDIEADDKLFGPLSLKQFIFAGTAVGFAFLAFMVATKVNVFAAIPLVPFILVPGILAAPLGRDQPTEIWLAAQVRFFLKPRKRIWDQSGLKELVTITVPKKIDHIYTDGLNQQEVRNRFNALANTIDSRGWVVKNPNLNLAAVPAYGGEYSDRLIDPTSLPQTVPDFSITASDDIMDAYNNPTAEHFEQMVQASGQTQKASAIAGMQAARETIAQQASAVDYSSTSANQAPVDSNQVAFANNPAVAPQPVPQYQPNNVGYAYAMAPAEPAQVQTQQAHSATAANYENAERAEITGEPEIATTATIDDAEKAILDQIHQNKAFENQTRNPHHRTIKTTEQLATEAAEQRKIELAKAQAVTPTPNPGNIELAKDAGDLKIATIAGLAKKRAKANPNEGEIHIQH